MVPVFETLKNMVLITQLDSCYTKATLSFQIQNRKRRIANGYLMPDETALRELSVVVIEKLKLLTDAEFAELEFPLD